MIVLAINSPAPDFWIAFANDSEPTNKRIVFISIDFIAVFSVMTLVATKISAPIQAEIYNGT